ncbi:MAG TPA: NYN domain-containing protein, partial [Longimicrobium sp.]
MQQEQKRVALFVDFDNIYLGLLGTSREAAEAFATRPHVWLEWIKQGMPMEPRRADAPGPRENRVLIRRCYLNPDTFGKYRGYFTRSGFSVVDCPPLTSRGKNSSDIVMVMDILDALRHETHFDRFVIMSADADFTPVLQRLRAHDRRTAVLVSGQAAPAYRAACDRLITEDAF